MPIYGEAITTGEHLLTYLNQMHCSTLAEEISLLGALDVQSTSRLQLQFHPSSKDMISINRNTTVSILIYVFSDTDIAFEYHPLFFMIILSFAMKTFFTTDLYLFCLLAFLSV